MLSPRWASSRIAAASPMVSEVPPPPVAVSSCGINDETAVVLRVRFFQCSKKSSQEGGSNSLPMVSTIPVNILGGIIADCVVSR